MCGYTEIVILCTRWNCWNETGGHKKREFSDEYVCENCKHWKASQRQPDPDLKWDSSKCNRHWRMGSRSERGMEFCQNCTILNNTWLQGNQERIEADSGLFPPHWTDTSSQMTDYAYHRPSNATGESTASGPSTNFSHFQFAESEMQSSYEDSLVDPLLPTVPTIPSNHTPPGADYRADEHLFPDPFLTQSPGQATDSPASNTGWPYTCRLNYRFRCKIW